MILTDVQTGRRYTFDDLSKLSLNFGSRLQERLQWRTGHVLTIFSMNVIDIPPIVWGTVAIGGVVSPLNPNFSATELVHYLKTSQAKAIVTQKSQYAKVAQAAKGAGLPKDRIIVIDNDDDASGDNIWQRDPYLIPDNKFDSVHKSPITRPKEELAFLVFSSGTTGLPKGVMLSHANIVANLLQMEAVDAGFLDSKDRALAFLPFFHIYGKCVVLLWNISHISNHGNAHKQFLFRYHMSNQLRPLLGNVHLCHAPIRLGSLLQSCSEPKNHIRLHCPTGCAANGAEFNR